VISRVEPFSAAILTYSQCLVEINRGLHPEWIQWPLNHWAVPRVVQSDALVPDSILDASSCFNWLSAGVRFPEIYLRQLPDSGISVPRGFPGLGIATLTRLWVGDSFAAPSAFPELNQGGPSMDYEVLRQSRSESTPTRARIFLFSTNVEKGRKLLRSV
jgi:hypothetical protein